MTIVKRPPESVSRWLSLEKPVSELLGDYGKLVDCRSDYLANFALKKTPSHAPQCRNWKISNNDAVAGKTAPKRPA